MANSSKENSPSPPNNNPQNTSIDNAGGSPPPPETTEAIQGLNSSPSSPTPPPAIPSGPGGSSSESKNKRRENKSGDSVEDQKESGQKKKKKRREMDAPAGDPICCICGKKFGSWKGVFGHFRAHTKSRDWRGAFPPPTADMLAWLPRSLPPEQTLAPTLLRLARETLAKMRQENISDSGAGSSTGAPTTGFDLNKEPPEEPNSVQAGPSFPPLLPPPQGGGEDGGLDLNLTPTEEIIDEEIDDGDVTEGASMND